MEPGLDRHEWEGEMSAIEEQLSENPEESLPELDELLGRMLVESGYDLDPSRIGPRGRTLRCAACRDSWFVTVPAAAEAVGSESADTGAVRFARGPADSDPPTAAARSRTGDRRAGLGRRHPAGS